MRLRYLVPGARFAVLEEALKAGGASLPPGTVLVVVHTGGGRAKALADQLKKLGAQVHPCDRITKPADRADFVRQEFRTRRVKVSDDTVNALLASLRTGGVLNAS